MARSHFTSHNQRLRCGANSPSRAIRGFAVVAVTATPSYGQGLPDLLDHVCEALAHRSIPEGDTTAWRSRCAPEPDDRQPLAPCRAPRVRRACVRRASLGSARQQRTKLSSSRTSFLSSTLAFSCCVDIRERPDRPARLPSDHSLTLLLVARIRTRRRSQ